MSTHNICFHGKNKKDISISQMKKAAYLLLCIISYIKQLFKSTPDKERLLRALDKMRNQMHAPSVKIYHLYTKHYLFVIFWFSITYNNLSVIS